MTNQTTNQANDQDAPQEATDDTLTDAQPTDTNTNQGQQDASQERTEAQEETNKKSPSAEAKKYRLRLRQAEAERDAAQVTIQQLQETVLANALEGSISITPQTGNRPVHEDGTPKTEAVKLRNPEDLFTVGGTDRGSLFDNNGALDTEALSRAASALHSSRPDLFDTATNGAVKAISSQPEIPSTAGQTWQNLLQGK